MNRQDEPKKESSRRLEELNIDDIPEGVETEAGPSRTEHETGKPVPYLGEPVHHFRGKKNEAGGPMGALTGVNDPCQYGVFSNEDGLCNVDWACLLLDNRRAESDGVVQNVTVVLGDRTDDGLAAGPLTLTLTLIGGDRTDDGLTAGPLERISIEFELRSYARVHV